MFTLHSLFFFSSRRRHTRSLCDWSSDVCSSDLKQKTAYEITRLNSSHTVISYAVFCLKKQNNGLDGPQQCEMQCTLLLHTIKTHYSILLPECPRSLTVSNMVIELCIKTARLNR